MDTVRRFKLFNQVTIVGLTVVGLGMDGYTFDDAIAFVSFLLWLFLPEVIRGEVHYLGRLARRIKK